jgi:dTDP-4-amino-4,6-dideoxygalactose transaminase
MLVAVDDRLRIHRKLAEFYDGLLARVPGLRIGKRPANCVPNFWLYTVLVDERERLISKLHKNGVHAATPHQRNDRLFESWARPTAGEHLVNLRKFSQSYMCLPIGPWIRLADIDRICGLIQAGW